MTAPAVPSPQEELRAEIAAVLNETEHLAASYFRADHDELIEELLPLFAARVAAIEAERDYARHELVEMHGRPPGLWDELLSERRTLRADLTAAQERIASVETEVARYRGFCGEALCSDLEQDRDAWEDRAQRAEERVAAERKQAAAQANLGLATTRELIAELTARIDVDHASGGGGLDYSTVTGRTAAEVPATPEEPPQPATCCTCEYPRNCICGGGFHPYTAKGVAMPSAGCGWVSGDIRCGKPADHPMHSGEVTDERG